jgi:Tol biopolymer transport system component
MFVVTEEGQGPVFDVVYFQGFSPDGSRFAYVGEEGKAIWEDTTEFVVVDNKKGDAYRRIETPISFSADGRRIAYAAEKGDFDWEVVVGGQKWRFESVTGVPVFSPDGSRFAFSAGDSEGKSFVVLDGRQQEKYEYVSEPVFSPDGNTIAFQAGLQSTLMHVDKWVIVVNGKRGRAFDGMEARVAGRPTPLAFSPDGTRLVYSARQGEEYFLVEDDKIITKGMSPVFSPDGRRLVYKYLKGSGWVVVVDNWEGEKFDNIDISSLVFSPDSSSIAYPALKKPHYYHVWNHRLSEPLCPFDSGRFSPDSRHIAYAAARSPKDFRKRELLVVDEKIRGEFKRLWNPVFSPDSKRIAFTVLDGNQLWWKVMDVESR